MNPPIERIVDVLERQELMYQQLNKLDHNPGEMADYPAIFSETLRLVRTHPETAPQL